MMTPHSAHQEAPDTNVLMQVNTDYNSAYGKWISVTSAGPFSYTAKLGK